MDKIIYVNFLSRFANNIFQYAFAHIINDLIGGKVYYSPINVIRSGISHSNPAEAIPISEMSLYGLVDLDNVMDKKEWSGKFNEEEKVKLRRTGVWFAEDIIEYHQGGIAVSEKYKGEPIILSGYYQDVRYYNGRKKFISDLLGLPKTSSKSRKMDIVLHIRCTDLAWAQMPLSFYRSILGNERFSSLSIVTEDPGSIMVRKLQSFYPTQILSNSVIDDFLAISSGNKIIMSVSTFSWMAAWLSNAERIYFPVGSSYPVFDKNNDKRLIVTDEQRYLYVSSRVPKWINAFENRYSGLSGMIFGFIVRTLKSKVFGYNYEQYIKGKTVTVERL